jgi:signal transduction histidine kinase
VTIIGTAGGSRCASAPVTSELSCCHLQRTPHRRDIESLDGVLKPVALSFANVLLLQEVANTAVKEERSRLARELHDEIGPTLATLGLALDTAVVQADDGDIARHLSELRGSVADLVDDVRTTVADLRSERHGSLVTRLTEASHAMSPPPTVEVTLDERRPPRPSIIEDVSAIVIEAIRNAHQHSGQQQSRCAAGAISTGGDWWWKMTVEASTPCRTQRTLRPGGYQRASDPGGSAVRHRERRSGNTCDT